MRIIHKIIDRLNGREQYQRQLAQRVAVMDRQIAEDRREMDRWTSIQRLATEIQRVASDQHGARREPPDSRWQQLAEHFGQAPIERVLAWRNTLRAEERELIDDRTVQLVLEGRTQFLIDSYTPMMLRL